MQRNYLVRWAAPSWSLTSNKDLGNLDIRDSETVKFWFPTFYNWLPRTSPCDPSSCFRNHLYFLREKRNDSSFRVRRRSIFFHGTELEMIFPRDEQGKCWKSLRVRSKEHILSVARMADVAGIPALYRVFYGIILSRLRRRVVVIFFSLVLVIFRVQVKYWEFQQSWYTQFALLCLFVLRRTL